MHAAEVLREEILAVVGLGRRKRVWHALSGRCVAAVSEVADVDAQLEVDGRDVPLPLVFGRECLRAAKGREGAGEDDAVGGVAALRGGSLVSRG